MRMKNASSVRVPRFVATLCAAAVVGCIVAVPSAVSKEVSASGFDKESAISVLGWAGVKETKGTELGTVQLNEGQDDRAVDATIIASLWPSHETRQRMPHGSTFSLTPIDRVDTRAGRAEVHAPDANVLRAHTSKDGTVLINLDVFTDEGWTTLFIERALDSSGEWKSSHDVLNPPTVTKLKTPSGDRDLEARSLGSEGVPSDVEVFILESSGLGSYEALPEELVDAVQPEGTLGERHHNTDLFCAELVSDGYGTAPQVVVSSAVTNGIQANVTYTKSAKTTTSMGIQVDGGAWSISGSSTKESTLAGAFNTVTGASGSWTNRDWRATWQHQRYYRHCPKKLGAKTPWIIQRLTMPTKVVGFPAIVSSKYALPGCVSKHDLTGVKSISTGTAKASTYAKAFSLSYGGASFSGSSQSGYNSGVKIKFTRPTSSGYWYWCGSTHAPQDSARVRAGR